jgi:putative oxidoreductase
MTNGNIDLGLLILRIWFGLEMAFVHGWPKLMKVFSGDMTFADPLGLGMGVSLVLAVFGEFTRLACIPFMITMLVAAFITHGDDGWGKMALPLMYVVAGVVLLITGPGRYSADHRFFVRKVEG